MCYNAVSLYELRGLIRGSLWYDVNENKSIIYRKSARYDCAYILLSRTNPAYKKHKSQQPDDNKLIITQILLVKKSGGMRFIYLIVCTCDFDEWGCRSIEFFIDRALIIIARSSTSAFTSAKRRSVYFITNSWTIFTPLFDFFFDFAPVKRYWKEYT